MVTAPKRTPFRSAQKAGPRCPESGSSLHSPGQRRISLWSHTKPSTPRARCACAEIGGASACGCSTEPSCSWSGLLKRFTKSGAWRRSLASPCRKASVRASRAMEHPHARPRTMAAAVPGGGTVCAPVPPPPASLPPDVADMATSGGYGETEAARPAMHSKLLLQGPDPASPLFSPLLARRQLRRRSRRPIWLR